MPTRPSSPAASSSDVAIARALATKPKVLLCDEATSALDPNTTHQILQLIRELNRELGITVVIITHQMSVVKEICDKVAILDGGEVAEEGLVSAVFAAPKSAAGRRLVFPGGADALVSDPASGAVCGLFSGTARPPVFPWWPGWRRRRASTAMSSPPAPSGCPGRSTAACSWASPAASSTGPWTFIKAYPNIQVEEVEHNVQ